MELDPGIIDPGTSVGQITILIAAVAALLTPLGGLISKWPKKDKRDYQTLVAELKRAKRERDFQGILISNLSDWQLTARQLLFLKRSELAAHDIKLKKRMVELRETLDEIDNRDPYETLEEIEKSNDNSN